ncbi:DUF3152 domain-containing protein [Actinoplanes teichomyceticus]|uniref:DUF3152 domain-containing protein n=1 Tax=Actinoplanes teichomyceticus TaxID=1867 RepID=UPI001EF2F618|nr:DUF3152 domain-containing protein [Actinoplanes teichomyceticus]
MVDPETGLPPGMTRGILELAAERLAAARAARSAAEPPKTGEPAGEAAAESPQAARPATTRRLRGARPSPPEPSESGPCHPGTKTPGPLESDPHHPGTRTPGPLKSDPHHPGTQTPEPPSADPPPAQPADPAATGALAGRVARRRPINRPTRPAAVAPPPAQHPPVAPADFRPPPYEAPATPPPSTADQVAAYEAPVAPPSTADRAAAYEAPTAPPADPALAHEVAAGRPPLAAIGRSQAHESPVQPADLTPGAASTTAAPAMLSPADAQPALPANPYDTAEFPQIVADQVYFEEPAEEAHDAAWFWSTPEQPPVGLPESVRIPDGLWHPAEQDYPDGLDQPTREQPVYVDPPAPEQAIPHQTAPERPVGPRFTGPVPGPAADTPAVATDHAVPAAAAPSVESDGTVSAVESDRAAPAVESGRAAPAVESGRAAPAVESGRAAPAVDIDRAAPAAGGPAGEPLTGRRLLRRRSRVTFVAYLLVVALVLVVGHELQDRQLTGVADREAAPPAADREAAPPPAGPVGAAPQPGPAGEGAATEAERRGSVQGAPPAAGEETGRAGDFRYVRTRGPVLGEAGRLQRFRVAVEETVDGVEPDDFAASVDDILGDERSWIGGGKVRLRRVPGSGAGADFTVYLATPATSERMCATGGLHTDGFTSCRLPGRVVINAERWADAIPDYAGDIGRYRQYVINHEVGHQLGHGHEACPGRGRPAPVMLPQTYGLGGCIPHAWPYRDGKRYSGEPRP